MKVLISALAILFLVSPAFCTTTVTIDFTTDTNDPMMPGSTGDLIDVINNTSSLPQSFDVVENSGSLMITIESISSFDSAVNPSDTSVNATTTRFGINSPTPPFSTEDADQFDVDSAEQLTISFNSDVFLQSVDLVSLTGDEAFTVASITDINDTNTTTGDVFDFTDLDAAGVFVATGNPILLQATGPAGSSVGLQALTIIVIPEPSSTLLIIVGGVTLSLRRRRL